LEISENAPLGVAGAKRAIHAGLANGIEAGLLEEARGQVVCLQSADLAEGVAAFLEKRKPKYRGE
ncbi:MAG: enoyl-CoA hydratase/isomerase family protein, partial [Vicinamibacteria bacterium]